MEYFRSQHSKQSLFYVFACVLMLNKATKAQWQTDDDGCRTPDRGVGTCINIYNCQHMINFLQENQKLGLSSEARQVLLRYQCGFEGKQPKVCCPDKPITLNRPRPTSATPAPTRAPLTSNNSPIPPDVSSHKNLNLLPNDCGVTNVDRITNGNLTRLFEFPWMALISYETDKGPSFQCGGTLISPKYVLTAAHCLVTKFRILGVRLGEHDLASERDCESHLEDDDEDCAVPPQNFGIEEIISHESYNTPTFSNDIGLIRLSGVADTSVDSVKTICLPTTAATRNFNFYSNKLRLIVTGWGATETGRRSQVLLKANIPVVPANQCVQLYEKQAKLDHTQVCAGGSNGTDSCSGDSGGPVQQVASIFNDARYLQLGIVSFGPRFCGTGRPGVYIKVAYYMDWILDKLKP